MRAARAARHAENNDLTLTIATSKSVPSATTLANLAGTSSRADPCKTGSSSGRPRPSPPMKWNASAATPPSSETVAVRRRRGVFSRRVGGRVNGRATPRRGTGSSRRDDDDDDARQRSNRDGATAGGQFPLPYPGIDGPRPPRPARKLRENLPGPGATRIMHEGAENRDDVVDPAARPKKYSRKRPRSAIAQKLTAAVPSAPGSMGAEVVMPTPVDSRQYHCGDSRRCRTGEERREVSNCQGEHHQRKRNARPASAPLGRSQDAKALLGLSQMIDGSYSKSPGELRITKWVFLREIYVDKLRGVLAARRGCSKHAAANSGCSVRGRTDNERELLLRLLVELLAVLRRITVEIIEAIQRWRGPGGKRPFLWGSSNYLLKVVEDVAFLGRQPGLEEHLGVCLGGNPLLCHVGLDGRPTFRSRHRVGEGEELGVDSGRFLASASLGVSADRLEAATEVLRREVNHAGRAMPGANRVHIPVATFPPHETRRCPDDAADRRTSLVDQSQGRSTDPSLRGVGSDSGRSVGCGDHITPVFCDGRIVEGSEKPQSQRKSPGREARIPDTLSSLDMKPDVRNRGPEPVIQEDIAESCEECEGGTSLYNGMPASQQGREAPEAVIGEAQQSKPGLPSGESGEESVAFQSVGARDDHDRQREQHHGAVEGAGGFEAVGISPELREEDSFRGTHQGPHRTDDRRRDTEAVLLGGMDKAGGSGNHTTRDEDVAQESSPFHVIHAMCDGLLTNLRTTGLSGCTAGGSVTTPAACTDHRPAELPQGGRGGENGGPRATTPSSESSPIAGGLSCHGSDEMEHCSKTTRADCRAENRDGSLGSQEGRMPARGESECLRSCRTIVFPSMSAGNGDLRCGNPEEEGQTEHRSPRPPESMPCDGKNWREVPDSRSDGSKFDVRHGLNTFRIYSRGRHIEAQDRPDRPALEAACSRLGIEDRERPQRAWQRQSNGASGSTVHSPDVQEALEGDGLSVSEGDGARAVAALPSEERTSDEARLIVEKCIGHMIRKAMEDVFRLGRGETARRMTWTKNRRSGSESVLPEGGSAINDPATGIARFERGEGSPWSESTRATEGVGAKTSYLASSGGGSARTHEETGARESEDAERSTHNGSTSHLASPLHDTEGNDCSHGGVHGPCITEDAAIDSFSSAATVLQHAWRAARATRVVRTVKNGEKAMRRPRRSRDAWSYAASRIVRAWRRQRARSRSWALSRALSEAAGEGDLRAVAFLLREKERQCLLPIGDGDAISSCRGRQPDAASVGCPQSQNDCSAAGGIRQMTGVAGRKRDLDGEPQLWSGQIDASEFAKAKATDRGDVPAAAARKEDSFGNLVVASGTETDPVADCVKYRETTPPTTVPPRELYEDRIQHADCRREMEDVEKVPAQDWESVACRDMNADSGWKAAGHLAIDYCNAGRRAVLLQPVETVPACSNNDATQGEQNHDLRGEKRSAESSRTDEAGDNTDTGCSRYLGVEEGEGSPRPVEHRLRGRAKESDGVINISAESNTGGNSDGAGQAAVLGGERRGQGLGGETWTDSAPAQSGPEKHNVGGLAKDKGLSRHGQEEPLSARFRDNDKERSHGQQGLEGSSGGSVTRKEIEHTDPYAERCEQAQSKVEKRSRLEETRSASSLKGRGGRGEDGGGQPYDDERDGIVVGDALDAPSPYRDCAFQDRSGDARPPQGGDSGNENDNHAHLRSLAWDGVLQGKAKSGCEVSECSLDEASASAGADEMGGGKMPEDAPEEWRDEDDVPLADSEADEQQQQSRKKIVQTTSEDEEATHGPPPATNGSAANGLPENDSKVARLPVDSARGVGDRNTTLVVNKSGSDGEAPTSDRPEMTAQARDGWVPLFDQDSGCWYYLDRESGLTQWEEPPGFRVKGAAASGEHPGEEIEEEAPVQAEVFVRS